MHPDMQKKFDQVQARLEARKAPPAEAPPAKTHDDVPDGVLIDAEFAESGRIEEAEEADLPAGRTVEELLKDGTAVAACSTAPPITLESCQEAMRQVRALKAKHDKDDGFEILKADTLRREFFDWGLDLPIVKVPGRVLVKLDPEPVATTPDPWRLFEEKAACFLEHAARGCSPEVYEAKRDILLKLLPVPLHPYADERLRHDLDLVSRELPHMLLELRQVSLGRNQLVSDEGWAELAHCYVAVAARVIRERLAPTYEHQLSEQDLAAVLREMVPHVLDECGPRIARAERKEGWRQREKVRVHPDPRDTDQLTARLLKTVASRGVSRARRELAADRLARRLDRAPTDRLETGLAHLEDLAFQLTMLQESAGLPDHLVIHSLHMMEAWLLDAFRNLATLSFREFYETVHKQAAQVLARVREVADGQTKANRSGAAGPVWHAGGPAVDDSVYAVCPGDQATPEQLTEEAKHAWQLRHERAVQEALAERRSRERGPASGPPADAQPGGDLADQASRLRDGGRERPWPDQL